MLQKAKTIQAVQPDSAHSFSQTTLEVDSHPFSSSTSAKPRDDENSGPGFIHSLNHREFSTLFPDLVA